MSALVEQLAQSMNPTSTTALAAFGVAFGAQATAMFVDERVHHRRRGLPRWERIGHPLDTLSVLACYTWLTLTSPTRTMAIVYGALAVFSSLFVTKDEPVHARRCTPAEHWLHAVLFVLHPIVLGCAGLVWWFGLGRLIVVPLVGTAAVGLYQLVYWNVDGPWRPKREQDLG